MTDNPKHSVAARLKRTVWLQAGALCFFVGSALCHLSQVGSLRWIDLVVPIWAALLVFTVQSLRKAQAKSDQ
jgi:hypothetical protein